MSNLVTYAKHAEDVYDWMKDNKPYEGAWVNDAGFVDKPENVTFFQLIADAGVLHIDKNVYNSQNIFFRSASDSNYLFEWDYQVDYYVNHVKDEQQVMTILGFCGEVEKVEAFQWRIFSPVKFHGLDAMNRIRFTSKRVIYITARTFNYLLQEGYIEVNGAGQLVKTMRLYSAIRKQFPKSHI